jgi:hypothetical protein
LNDDLPLPPRFTLLSSDLLKLPLRDLASLPPLPLLLLPLPGPAAAPPSSDLLMPSPENRPVPVFRFFFSRFVLTPAGQQHSAAAAVSPIKNS